MEIVINKNILVGALCVCVCVCVCGDSYRNFYNIVQSYHNCEPQDISFCLLIAQLLTHNTIILSVRVHYTLVLLSYITQCVELTLELALLMVSCRMSVQKILSVWSSQSSPTAPVRLTNGSGTSITSGMLREMR